MNKSKIDWCDYTWNPVTGCLHNCPYCYAKGITERFASHVETNRECIDNEQLQSGPCYELSEAWTRDGFIQPYPFGFAPTFHGYRLMEPKKKTKGVNVFVCSMADLFGEWIPDEWISNVFKACEEEPQHNYMFLTKDPERYAELFHKGILVNKPNYWYGTTRTTSSSSAYVTNDKSNYNAFFSVEPLHKKWDMSEFENKAFKRVQWVIIGAETGNRKDKTIPEKSWVEDIVIECKAAGVPVFMKSNLAAVWGNNLLQEYPEGLRKE
jgi:protein gp37